MRTPASQFLSDERGTGMAEYALVLFAVLLLGAVGVRKISPGLNTSADLTRRYLSGEDPSVTGNNVGGAVGNIGQGAAGNLGPNGDGDSVGGGDAPSGGSSGNGGSGSGSAGQGVANGGGSSGGGGTGSSSSSGMGGASETGGGILIGASGSNAVGGGNGGGGFTLGSFSTESASSGGSAGGGGGSAFGGGSSTRGATSGGGGSSVFGTGSSAGSVAGAAGGAIADFFSSSSSRSSSTASSGSAESGSSSAGAGKVTAQSLQSVMPPGLLGASGANEVNPPPGQGAVNGPGYTISANGEKQMQALLAKARANVGNKRPLGKCYHAVKVDIQEVGYGTIPKQTANGQLRPLPGSDQGYAHDFADYMNARGANGQTNATSLGLQKLPITNPYDAPPGSIIVVRAGTPGTRNPVAGDIVVAGGNGKFYNDGNMGYRGSKNFPPGNNYVLGIYAPR